MKRKSDLAKHQLPKNFPHDDSEFEYVRRQAKRNYTTLKLANEQIFQHEGPVFSVNEFRNTQIVISHLLTDLINSLQPSIQKIQKKRAISLSVQLINSISDQLYNLQDPQKDFNDTSKTPQKQPVKNSTDPISGFNKQNFIKKTILRHKMSHNQSIALVRQVSQTNLNQTQYNLKKLPPLMKQLSQQKLMNQVFIPLEDNTNLGRKKSSLDFQQLVRQRLLKEIQNRKFKQRIEELSTQVQSSQKNTNKNIKSTHDGDKLLLPKQDCTFDYDGNKISIFSHGKVKSNLKILKTMYKLPKQRAQDNKLKLPKKFHQRISYMPRCSRTYLQINNKTIGDFGDFNYSVALKEKIQMELRKTDMKFNQKQYFGKQRENKNSILA